MRKAKRNVKFDDILSSNFYGSDRSSLIDPVLRGHLILEAIIVEIIQIHRPGDKAWKWNFSQKTQYLVDSNIIDLGIKTAFGRINNLRNDFAHSFGHIVTVEYLLGLARELESNGIAFSDSIVEDTAETALENYQDIEGILSEIIWCVLFEAANVLEEQGGRDIF